MKIEIVVDPARPAPPASLVSRVAPPVSAAPATESQGTRFVQQEMLRSVPCLTNYRPAARGSRRGRGRGRKGNERPQKSVADLDAEMEVRLCTLFWFIELTFPRTTPQLALLSPLEVARVMCIR